MRIAAVLAWVTGLGFGLPGVYAIWYLAARDRVWTFFGFPTYGGGPFETIGIKTTPALVAGFVVVCGAELVAGTLLWQRQGAGVALALVLLPVEFAFWIGFALPAGLILGVARTAALIWTRF